MVKCGFADARDGDAVDRIRYGDRVGLADVPDDAGRPIVLDGILKISRYAGDSHGLGRRNSQKRQGQA